MTARTERGEFVAAARALLVAGWKRPVRAEWPVRSEQRYALLSPSESTAVAYEVEGSHTGTVLVDRLWYGVPDERALWVHVESVDQALAVLAAIDLLPVEFYDRYPLGSTVVAGLRAGAVS
jgi:hypothetical protein